MAASLIKLPFSPWHAAVCAICRCSINEKNVAAYRAVSIKSKTDVVHHIQSFHNDILTLEAGISYSDTRVIATSPEIRLLHTRCYKILRCTWANLTVPVTALILTTMPTLPIPADNYHSLSHLDAAALVTNLGNLETRATSKIDPRALCENPISEVCYA